MLAYNIASNASVLTMGSLRMAHMTTARCHAAVLRTHSAEVVGLSRSTAPVNIC